MAGVVAYPLLRIIRGFLLPFLAPIHIFISITQQGLRKAASTPCQAQSVISMRTRLSAAGLTGLTGYLMAIHLQEASPTRVNILRLSLLGTPAMISGRTSGPSG